MEIKFYPVSQRWRHRHHSRFLFKDSVAAYSGCRRARRRWSLRAHPDRLHCVCASQLALQPRSHDYVDGQKRHGYQHPVDPRVHAGHAAFPRRCRLRELSRRSHRRRRPYGLWSEIRTARGIESQIRPYKLLLLQPEHQADSGGDLEERIAPSDRPVRSGTSRRRIPGRGGTARFGG
jgi:hypothetical protein